jgi:LysR family transcriptional regulator, regulator for bpeEF and oprC
MDHLKALRVFVRVVDLKSFHQAARSLGVPKASVSAAIQQLEAHVNTRLLLRTTRRMSLTDDGAAYLAGARRVLDDVTDLDVSVKRAGSTARGKVRVDVPAAAGRHVIAPALPEFLRKYPDITIELGSSDRAVDLIAENIDCVIRGGPLRDESLIARRLGTFTTVTCASPAYLRNKGIPKNLADLKQQKHLAVNYFSAKSQLQFPLEFETRRGIFQRFELPSQVSANDADTQVELTCAGLGLAQLPLTRRLKTLLQAKRLVRVLPGFNAEPLPLSILYPQHRHFTARLRVFVDWVVERYAKEFSDD